MKVLVLGKQWILRFCHRLKNSGDCDPPWKSRKEIRIGADLQGQDRLEVILHELTHAAFWHLDEEYVAEFAEDASRILWKLGYRIGEGE